MMSCWLSGTVSCVCVCVRACVRVCVRACMCHVLTCLFLRPPDAFVETSLKMYCHLYGIAFHDLIKNELSNSSMSPSNYVLSNFNLRAVIVV